MKSTWTGESTRTTLTDIARIAGVSVTTVSRVLGGRSGEVKISDRTSARILEIARERDYRPNLFAKALRTNKSHLVGLVVWDLADPYYGAIVVGAQTALAKRGYTAVLSNAGRSETELGLCLSRMSAFQTDGALVAGGPPDLPHVLAAVNREDPRRTVFISTPNPNPDGATVIADNYEGARMGVEYLLTRWRRPLVWLRPQQSTYDVHERVRGVADAVAAHQHELESTTITGALGEEGGYRACRELLARTKPPFSLFAFTDLTALGAIHAAHDAGLKVPEDIAILGFDDLTLAAHTNPPLSTIRQPRGTLGSRGADILIGQLEAGDEERTLGATVETLPAELVVRETA